MWDSAKECKNIKHALKQLHRRYKLATNPKVARGILALSITDHANPEQGLMVGDSSEDIGYKIQRHVDAFILRQQSLWQRQNRDKRTIGVFVELSAPSVIESENLLTTCHQFAINNSCPQGTSDMALLLEFAKKLAEQGA